MIIVIARLDSSFCVILSFHNVMMRVIARFEGDD